MSEIPSLNTSSTDFYKLRNIPMGLIGSAKTKGNLVKICILVELFIPGIPVTEIDTFRQVLENILLLFQWCGRGMQTDVEQLFL